MIEQKLEKVPGLNSYQLLPKLRRIQQDTLGFLMDMTNQYGDLVSFEAGNNLAFLVNHPDWIKHILQDNHRNYSKDTMQYNALATITGKGLLTSDGAFWFRQRRLEQPAFSKNRLEKLDQVINPATRNMLARWDKHIQNGDLIDIDEEMMRLTLEIVGKALFNIDLSAEAQQLTTATLTVLDYIVHKARHPLSLPESFPTSRNVRFRRALQTLDNAVYKMLEERLSSGQAGGDMLGMLLKARDEETGQAMSTQQIRDEIITLLIAGHETVASALTWSWYLLGQNRGIWEKMFAEVQTILDGRDPGWEDFQKLEFTGQVFDEALRLYPPAWLITRKAIESDQLSQYQIPAGSLIVISPYVIHRHPTFWDAPEEFNPLRFAQKNDRQNPRYAYIPFGGGPRLCIGNQFALIEGRLILAMVTQHFRLEIPNQEKVKVDALVTLRPHNGLPVRLQKII